jgi:hypothetical protein
VERDRDDHRRPVLPELLELGFRPEFADALGEPLAAAVLEPEDHLAEQPLVAAKPEDVAVGKGLLTAARAAGAGVGVGPDGRPTARAGGPAVAEQVSPAARAERTLLLGEEAAADEALPRVEDLQQAAAEPGGQGDQGPG